MEDDEKDEFLAASLTKQTSVLDSMQKALEKVSNAVDDRKRVSKVNLSNLLRDDVHDKVELAGLESDYELVETESESEEALSLS